MVVQEDLHHLRLLQSGDSLITSPAQPMIDAWPPLTRTPHSRRLVNPLDDVTPAVSADDDDAASMPSTPHSVFRPFASPDPLETASPSPSSFSVASTNRSYSHRRRPPLNFSSLTPTSFNASPPASSTSTLPLTPLPFERWTPQTPSSPLNSPFTLPNTPTPGPQGHKQYDYLLKFLLVGDSDVGKQEILSGLDDGGSEMVFCSGPAHKTTTILLDGKRVRLELWDTSGQGRFCTIIRSYSRGAQGILLVYDITNKWSFDGLDRWLREVEEHAPGVPKVLVGNRLHLEFKRAVSPAQAEAYAARHDMAFFEVSPLCDYNIAESFAELSRRALRRNGMERLWRANKVLSLQELCCRTIVNHTTVYGIERLPLPPSLKYRLKSYALSGTSYRTRGRALMASQSKKHKSIQNMPHNNSWTSWRCVIS